MLYILEARARHDIFDGSYVLKIESHRVRQEVGGKFYSEMRRMAWYHNRFAGAIVAVIIW